MKRSIQKVDKCLSMIENAVIILGLSAMFLILLAQVIMRYVFSRPLTWSEEAARFIFVYVSFIGISYAYRQKGHIRMEVVVNLFPQAVRRGLEVLINLDTIALFCYMIPFATVYKGNIIKNLIMDCQSYTKYRPNETTGGIFVSWRRKEELPTGA